MQPEKKQSKIILDWGCGRRKHPGAIGMDNVDLPGVDIVHDLLAFPYPFSSGYADEIILSHVLEHFTLPEILSILAEANRVLAPRGIVTVSVPHALCVAFQTDPTHQTRFSFETMYYLTGEHSFSYYKRLPPGTLRVSRLWGSVNLFNHNIVPVNALEQKLDHYSSRVMSYIVRHSRSLRLPDLLVKQLPLWLVSIHCHLSKTERPGDKSAR